MGLRYGRKTCICDIRYWLVLYELKILPYYYSTRIEISTGIPIEVLPPPLGLWVEWINGRNPEKGRRIQRMVRNKEMDEWKSYGFEKTLSIGTKKDISK